MKNLLVTILLFIAINSLGQQMSSDIDINNWDSIKYSANFEYFFQFAVECSNDSLFVLTIDSLNKYMNLSTCKILAYDKSYQTKLDTLITLNFRFNKKWCFHDVEPKYSNFLNIYIDSNKSISSSYLYQDTVNSYTQFIQDMYNRNGSFYKNSTNFYHTINGKKTKTKALVTHVFCRYNNLQMFTHSEWELLFELINSLKRQYKLLYEKLYKRFNDKKISNLYAPVHLMIHLDGYRDL